MGVAASLFRGGAERGWVGASGQFRCDCRNNGLRVSRKGRQGREEQKKLRVLNPDTPKRQHKPDEELRDLPSPPARICGRGQIVLSHSTFTISLHSFTILPPFPHTILSFAGYSGVQNMNTRLTISTATALLIPLVNLPASDWRQFRGPNGSGIAATDAQPATT